jgi:hypothetical protein
MAKARKRRIWLWIALPALAVLATILFLARANEPDRALQLFGLLSLAIPVIILITYCMGLLPILVHELGHLIAGKAVGFKLVAFHVGPFGYSIVARPRFYLNSGQWFGGGYVAMTSVNLERLVMRNGVFIAAGPLASILLTAIGMQVWLATEMHPVATGFLLMSLAAVFNSVVPRYHKGIATDAMVLWTMAKPGPLRDRAISQLTIANEVLGGIRPRDWNPATLERLRLPEDGKSGEAYSRLILYLHCMDQGDFEVAGEHIARAVSVAGNLDGLFQDLLLHIWIEAAFYEAFVRRNPDAARQALEQLGTVPKRIETSRIRVLAAIAMVEGRVEEARSLAVEGSAKVREFYEELRLNPIDELEMFENILAIEAEDLTPLPPTTVER